MNLLQKKAALKVYLQKLLSKIERSDVLILIMCFNSVMKEP